MSEKELEAIWQKLDKIETKLLWLEVEMVRLGNYIYVTPVVDADHQGDSSS